MFGSARNVLGIVSPGMIPVVAILCIRVQVNGIWDVWLRMDGEVRMSKSNSP